MMVITTATAGINPITTIAPVTIPSTDRGDDLIVRVTAPVTGDQLPVIVFSHGMGSSSDEYRPLLDFWAANGFVTVQPTHLDSPTLGLTPTDQRTPDIWKTRADDLVTAIDSLADLESALPGLAGRVDTSRIIVAGHSWGAQSASMLLGARVVDSDGQPGESRKDNRVMAGVFLSITGSGGDDLTAFAQENFAFMSPDFAQMTLPALTVAGDHDDSPLSHRGPDWFTDAHRLAPKADLLTMNGGEHTLGGIAGTGLVATTDENPDRVALIQRATTAYLHSIVDPSNDSWANMTAELAEGNEAVGYIDAD